MARDFARVSAMEGMMWFGFVHCRRSFLQQGMGFKAWAPPRVHTCVRARHEKGFQISRALRGRG